VPIVRRAPRVGGELVTRAFLGVDPGLASGGAAIVDDMGRALLLAGWCAGRAYIEEAGRAERYVLGAGESAAASVLQYGALAGVAIEQPLTVGVGRHADTWRSVGHWEQAAHARGLLVRLVPFRTWTRAADIAGFDGVAEVRRRVRELTAHLDPMLPAGAQSRGGWPAQARDAAREAYLIARWCALEVGP
jgi:hypothetical protein